MSGIGLGRLGPRRCPDCGKRWASRVASYSSEASLEYEYRKTPARVVLGKTHGSLVLACPEGHTFRAVLRRRPGGGIAVGVPVRT